MRRSYFERIQQNFYLRFAFSLQAYLDRPDLNFRIWPTKKYHFYSKELFCCAERRLNPQVALCSQILATQIRLIFKFVFLTSGFTLILDS